jgi:hypothetical protein
MNTTPSAHDAEGRTVCAATLGCRAETRDPEACGWHPALAAGYWYCPHCTAARAFGIE